MFRKLAAAVLALAAGVGSAFAILNGLPAVPTITSICTTQGPTSGGDTVVITGTNMVNVTGVTFSGTSVGTQWFYNNPNGTGVTAISPPGAAGIVDVRVSNPSGSSAIVAADKFTYVNTALGVPLIQTVVTNVESTLGNDQVNIIGYNLSSPTAVTFGAIPAPGGFGSFNSSIIHARTPAHAAGTVDITVTTAGGTSPIICADQFTFCDISNCSYNYTGNQYLPAATRPAATAARPSYNTGTGYFVVGRGLYDPNGNLFIPRGANAQHSSPGSDLLNKFSTNMNAEREVIWMGNGTSCGTPPPFNSGCMKGFMDVAITNHVVPIPMMDNYQWVPSQIGTSGDRSSADLQTAVNNWAGTSGCATGTWPCASSWTQPPYNQAIIVNLANEWGPCISDSGAMPPGGPPYVSAYATAVQTMRAAGFTQTLLIDSGCSGSDNEGIPWFAAQLQANDPQHNIIVANHVYTRVYYTQGAPTGGSSVRLPPLIAQYGGYGTSGITVPIIFGEVGCFSGGCAQQLADFTPDKLAALANFYNIGYLFWAIDNGGCDDTMLGNSTAASPQTCTTGGNRCYKDQAGTEVTTLFGAQAIDPPNGLYANSVRSTYFTGPPPPPPACPF